MLGNTLAFTLFRWKKGEWKIVSQGEKSTSETVKRNKKKRKWGEKRSCSYSRVATPCLLRHVPEEGGLTPSARVTRWRWYSRAPIQFNLAPASTWCFAEVFRMGKIKCVPARDGEIRRQRRCKRHGQFVKKKMVAYESRCCTLVS